MTVDIASEPSHYERLEQMLRAKLQRQPDLLPVHMRLLDLYFETGQRDAFVAQARVLREQLGAGYAQSSNWVHVAESGRRLVPQEAMFRTGAAAGVDFVPVDAGAETLKYARIGEGPRYADVIAELASAYAEARADAAFIRSVDHQLQALVGRPTPLYHARRMSEKLGGAQLFFKREDQGDQHAHLAAAIVGQAVLAQRMGRRTLVAASLRGRSGVWVAMIAARLGMQATIFVDAEQVSLQRANLFRMSLMGARIEQVDTREMAADVRHVAFDHWAAHADTCFMIMGLQGAPQPYPAMTMDFVSAIGRECARQLQARMQREPDILVARGGETSDALGLLPPFLGRAGTRLVCVDPQTHLSAEAKTQTPRNTVFDPLDLPLTVEEQQRATQILEGMEYPRVVREHAWLCASGGVETVQVQPLAARQAITELAHQEGILLPIQTAYAAAWALAAAKTLTPDQAIIVLLAETVDKDIWDIGRAMAVEL